jgi:periplasmic copper chaperone A
MKHRLLIALLITLGLLLGACGGGTATDTQDAGDRITVTDARSRMSPMVTGAAAVYLQISNSTGADDALVAVRVGSDIAAAAELHETYQKSADPDGEGDMDEGDMGDGPAPMAGMREVSSIPVPAGETVELRPGGLHVMLLDLTEGLAPGDEFPLTLEFEQAGEVTVTVEVREDV